MDCLHGVLMHNDGEQGGDHNTEDQYLRFKAKLDTGSEKAGPQNGEQLMHDTLMHGDSSSGHSHEENGKILPEVVAKAGPKDLNDVIHEGMHGDEGIPHKHDSNSADDKHNVNARKGPLDANQLMHGVLMHGNVNHVHDDDDSDDTDVSEEEKVPSVMSAEELMHGLLMHGDATHGKNHEHAEKVSVDEFNVIGPDGNFLHGILMHNDASVGHDHSDEDAHTKHEVFSDISKIKDIVLDEDLLKMIDLEKILMKDMEEYADWLSEGPSTTPEGSTTASVSDNILADIELMKRRYLDLAEDITEENLGVKDQPFTADDANTVLENHVHQEDGEGMKHDLELLGSTEPLNARHKVKLALEKEKK